MDTKKLRQKILDLAIRGKLVPQDPNDEPASVLLERIRAEKERLIKEGKIKRSKKSTSDMPHYENVPFEVPEGWEWTTIEDICSKIGSGSTPRGSNYAQEGIPFFRSQNVYNDGLVYDDIKYISEEVHENMIGTEVRAKDLLLNITGGSLGRCAIVPDEFHKGNVSQHVCILRTIIVLPSYLHLFIISDYFAATMILSGSGREGLPKYSLEIMQFPLPSIEEQKRIVAAVNKWFALIDTLESAKEDLQTSIEHTKSKILDLAIHGKLVPQDPNDEPAIELLKRINPKFTPCDNAHYENNTIEIPENWEWVKLSDIAVSELGKTLDKGKNSGTPHNYLCAFNVKWCSFDLSVIKKIPLEEEELERYKVRKGDLLICEGGDVGRAAIWESDQDIYYQNALHRVRFKDEINQYFYLYVLQYYKSLGMIDDVSGGVTIKHFTQNSMKKLCFPLPPIKEQQRIVSAINQYHTILDNISANL